MNFKYTNTQIHKYTNTQNYDFKREVLMRRVTLVVLLLGALVLFISSCNSMFEDYDKGNEDPHIRMNKKMDHQKKRLRSRILFGR